MRSFLPFICLCFIVLSCKKTKDSSATLMLNHKLDTIGGRLILSGAAFEGQLSGYTVVFNDRETKPSQRLSSSEIEVIVPVHARSGIVKLKSPSGNFQTADTFYVASQQRWKRAADFPGEGRILATAFVIGTKAYVTTGANKYNGSYFKDFWEYDSILNKWSRKADFPGTTRYMTLSFALNGKGYVGGGIYSPDHSCGQDLYEYTPESNTWQKKASAPAGADICYGSAVVFRGEGYVLSETEGRKTMVFNPTANTWTNNTTMKISSLVSKGSSFVLNDRLYYGMGTVQIPWSGLGDLINSEFYSYNFTANFWNNEDQRVPSPEQSMYRNAFVQGGEAYMAFGDAGRLYAYNPSSRSWRKVVEQNLGITSDCTNFTIGSRGFVVFGHRRFEDPGSKNLWVIELSKNPVVR